MNQEIILGLYLREFVVVCCSVTKSSATLRGLRNNLLK